MGRRLKTGLIVGGAVALLGAGIGIAAPGQDAPTQAKKPSQPTELRQGEIDPERAYETAVTHLVRSGMSREAAEARMKNQPRHIDTARALREQAPDDIQSLYINDAGELVANVVTEQGAKLARQAGATPRRVESTWKEMTRIQQRLRATAEGENATTTVGINPTSGRVEVTYSADSSREALAPLLAQAERYGDAVKVTKSTTTPQAAVDIHPGQQIEIGGQACTAGWAVDIEDIPGDPNSGFIDGIITAGHCLTSGATVRFSGRDAGTAFDVHDGPDGDYGFVELGSDFVSQPSLAFVENPVAGMETTMIVGSIVCKLGITSDETCGEITSVNESITLPNPDGTSTTYNGLVEASVCSRGGDSGGPVYTPTGSVVNAGSVTALGIVSVSDTANRSAPCTDDFAPSGEFTLFQPLGTVLPSGGPYNLKIAGGNSGS
jgi:hypothetical protein